MRAPSFVLFLLLAIALSPAASAVSLSSALAEESTLACGGTAPLVTRCTFDAEVAHAFQLTVRTLFTGTIAVEMTSSGGGARSYEWDLVSGVPIASRTQGTGLYVGTVTLVATTRALESVGAPEGGAGNWEVSLTYS